MTHRFNAEHNTHKLAHQVLSVVGTKVWCRGTQIHEHMATVVKYKNYFTQVFVKWYWDSGIKWRDGSWIDVHFVRP